MPYFAHIRRAIAANWGYQGQETLDEDRRRTLQGRRWAGQGTLQPFRYAWLPLNTKNKHYREYSKGRPSELLLTDRKVCLTFVVGGGKKPLGRRLIASDLNFNAMDSTQARFENGRAKLESANTEPLKQVVQIQNDFSRRRRAIQCHIRNAQKRKLRETRGRQMNRVRDALHKLSARMVKENPDTSFIFESYRE